MASELKTPKTVVVVGAGFAGLTALRNLTKHSSELKIILISETRHFIYNPTLWEFYAYINPEDEFGIDLKEYCHDHRIEFIHDPVQKIDAAKKTIECGKQHLSYDYLLLASGAKTNYYGIPGLQENSLELKEGNDARRIKEQLTNLVKHSIDHPNAEKMKILVGGGGLSGVEIAAGVSTFLQDMLHAKSNALPFEIVIADAAPTILNGFPKKAIDKTLKYLSAHAIAAKNGSPATKVEKDLASGRLTVTFKDNTVLSADLIIWAGGVKPADYYIGSGLELNERGSVLVNEYLQAKKNEEVFAAGDCCLFPDPKTQKPLPMSAHYAMVEGGLAAENILAHSRIKHLKQFKPMTPSPIAIGLDKRYGIIVYRNLVLSGSLMKFFKFLIEKYCMWYLK